MNQKYLTNDLEIIEVLGHGASSTVYKCLFTKGDLSKLVAVKVLKNSYINKNQSYINEIKHTAALIHPNICQIIDADQTNNNEVYVVYEFLDGLDLRELLNKGLELTPEQVLFIKNEIYKGIKYAHEYNIIHHDIKPENVFLTKHNEIKILDFGLSRDSGSQNLQGGFSGTLNYYDPYLIQNDKEYDKEADYFAIHLVIFELASRSKLFATTIPEDTFKELKNFEKINSIDLENIDSEEIVQILSNQLITDRSKRKKITHISDNILESEISFSPTPTVVNKRIKNKRKWTIELIVAFVILIGATSLYLYYPKIESKDLFYIQTGNQYTKYSVKKYNSYTNSTFQKLTCNILLADLLSHISLFERETNKTKKNHYRRIREKLWLFITKQSNKCTQPNFKNIVNQLRSIPSRNLNDIRHDNILNIPDDIYSDYTSVSKIIDKSKYLDTSASLGLDLYTEKKSLNEEKCSSLFEIFLLQNNFNILNEKINDTKTPFSMLILSYDTSKYYFQIKGQFKELPLFEINNSTLFDSYKICYGSWDGNKKEVYFSDMTKSK